MAALNRRDIEMIFRAETDKATRPIADLGKAVKSTNSQLKDLVEAAASGEVSLDKLGDATRDLKKAQDELGTARSLLTQLNAQEAALAKAEERADAAAQKYAALSAQVAATENPTKRLKNSMEAAGRASAAAAENLDTVRREASETREQITAIIGPVDNVGDSFRQIAVAGQEIARGLAVAGAAADDFKQQISAAARAASEADAKMKSDAAFQQSGQSAGLLQSQIDYISQFENRVELLAQAKRELSAQDAAFSKALEAQEAKVGAANVAALERQIRDAFAASEQAERVTAFQKIAVEARAGIDDVSRFGVAQDAAGESAERLAAALGRILAPTAAVNRTLDSIEATITQASAALEGGRKSAADYGNALNDLSSAAAGINAIAGKIDGYEAQQASLAASTAKFEEARAEAGRLAQALLTPGEDAEKIAAQLRRAEAALESAGQAMREDATKAAEMGAALRRAGVDVNNLTAAEKRLTAAAAETAAATSEVTNITKGKGNFLGLSPTDATNLSYQINDIFTQLASGQSIFITLAQQGPQIWQIGGVQAFAAGLSGLLIPLAAVAGGLAAVAASAYLVYQVTSPSAEVKAATAFLKSQGEQADITAKQMAKLSKELQFFGEKSDEANKIAQEFASAGLNPEYIDAYAKAVANAAQVTGVDMSEASDKLTAALTGGFDAAVALNDQFGVLTDSELAQIRVMYESGQADEARQLIFDRFTGKMKDAADYMNGPWANAWISIKKVAEAFGTYINYEMNRYLKGLRQYLDDVAVGVNYLLLRMRGFSKEEAGRAAVLDAGRAPDKKPPKGRITPNGAAPNAARGDAAIAQAERELDVRKRLTAAQRLENAAIQARNNALNSGYGAERAERLAVLARQKEQRAINDENAKAGARAAKKAESARAKAEREAETLANKIASQQEQLQSALDTMGAKVAKLAAGTLQEQLASAATAVTREYDKLYRQLQSFAQLTGGKGKIGDKTIAEYRATLDANKQILTNQAQLKVYEDQVNAVLAQRKQLLADIEDRAARGEIKGPEAIARTQDITAQFEPMIANITKAAVDFANQIGGARPSAELQAFIAKMEVISNRNAGSNQKDVRDVANASIGREEAKLNQILAERNALVESYNTLAQLGLITEQEARNKSAAAYNQSKVLIEQQLAALRAVVNEANQMAVITPQAFDAFNAKMQAVGAQAEYVDPRLAQVKSSIDQIITGNIVEGIDRIAKSMVGFVTGTQDAGDVIAEVGKALVDKFAQTLVMIAKLIIQMLILDAIQKATGIPVGALLQATNGGGGGGGGGRGILGFLGALFHGGGKPGSTAGGVQRTSRISISPAAIASAPRFHEGTPAVGLKSNEQVAVVEKGEKIMTERQQELEAQAKARSNTPSRGLRQVLAFGDSEVAAAMAGPAGEDTTITHIRRNVPLLKQLLDNN